MEPDSYGLFIADGANLRSTGGTACYFRRSQLLKAVPGCLPQRLEDAWSRAALVEEPHVLVELVESVEREGSYALERGFVVVYAVEIALEIATRTEPGRRADSISISISRPDVMVLARPLSKHLGPALEKLKELASLATSMQTSLAKLAHKEPGKAHTESRLP